jgi:hypothetical protein
MLSLLFSWMLGWVLSVFCQLGLKALLERAKLARR